MTSIQIDRTAMPLRFVVDLTLFMGGKKYPGRFGDDISPEFPGCVRVLSFGLLPFVVPIFAMPAPTFAPDARPPGPCVNTTNVYTMHWYRLFYVWVLTYRESIERFNNNCAYKMHMRTLSNGSTEFGKIKYETKQNRKCMQYYKHITVTHFTISQWSAKEMVIKRALLSKRAFI